MFRFGLELNNLFLAVFGIHIELGVVFIQGLFVRRVTERLISREAAHTDPMITNLFGSMSCFFN